ncbi:hypothetical protein NEDG_01247 [Nematocida displodere]|uniref:Uncharacterized protein n=1 Tax=Nematocida displodere TaxID=1805483 RepID=A0A177EBB5_9MICR|nr:hypothetical protein NEDG_01247 [Nematocida displodere]
MQTTPDPEPLTIQHTPAPSKRSRKNVFWAVSIALLVSAGMAFYWLTPSLTQAPPPAPAPGPAPTQDTNTGSPAPEPSAPPIDLLDSFLNSPHTASTIAFFGAAGCELAITADGSEPQIRKEQPGTTTMHLHQVSADEIPPALASGLVFGMLVIVCSNPALPTNSDLPCESRVLRLEKLLAAFGTVNASCLQVQGIVCLPEDLALPKTRFAVDVKCLILSHLSAAALEWAARTIGLENCSLALKICDAPDVQSLSVLGGFSVRVLHELDIRHLPQLVDLTCRLLGDAAFEGRLFLYGISPELAQTSSLARNWACLGVDLAVWNKLTQCFDDTIQIESLFLVTNPDTLQASPIPAYPSLRQPKVRGLHLYQASGADTMSLATARTLLNWAASLFFGLDSLSVNAAGEQQIDGDLETYIQAGPVRVVSSPTLSSLTICARPCMLADPSPSAPENNLYIFPTPHYLM